MLKLDTWSDEGSCKGICRGDAAAAAAAAAAAEAYHSSHCPYVHSTGSDNISTLHLYLQSAIGAGVEDTREVRQRLVALEGNVVKMQRAEDKRAVEVMLKVSEQEVCITPLSGCSHL